jgi:sugar phosphate isomerase/epimerase
MHPLSRRQFAALAAAGSVLKAAPLGLPIGTQTYPVRDRISKDADGMFREIAAMGYKTIEMCSPQGYANSGFGVLADLKASELKQKIRAAGLGCESSHYNMREFRENLSHRIDYARELGLKQMIMASFAVGKDAKMADWQRAANEMNKFAEQIRKAGMEAGFHNHDVEFTELEGAVIYDKIMAELDPKLVKMQYQVAVARLGVNATEVFGKYPGRFISLHLQDYSPGDKRMVAIGKGAVDWKQLFAAAKKAGVKNYFVELPIEHMQDSYNFLRSLNV